VVGTNHFDDLAVSTELVNLGIDPYYMSENHGKTTTLLEESIRDPDPELLKKVCRSMVESNADFERKIAPSGRTALHIAAILRRYRAVGILLDHGAAVDAIDYYGRTALHLAIKREASASTMDNSDVLKSVSQLLRAGASQDVKDFQGKEALDYASPDFERPLRELFEKYMTFRA